MFWTLHSALVILIRQKICLTSILAQNYEYECGHVRQFEFKFAFAAVNICNLNYLISINL